MSDDEDSDDVGDDDDLGLLLMVDLTFCEMRVADDSACNRSRSESRGRGRHDMIRCIENM